jgi:hypothetical protein
MHAGVGAAQGGYRVACPQHVGLVGHGVEHDPLSAREACHMTRRSASRSPAARRRGLSLTLSAPVVNPDSRRQRAGFGGVDSLEGGVGEVLG